MCLLAKEVPIVNQIKLKETQKLPGEIMSGNNSSGEQYTIIEKRFLAKQKTMTVQIGLKHTPKYPGHRLPGNYPSTKPNTII